MAAGRRSARCWNGSRSRVPSSTACASPTRIRSRSSKWCCRARSTRRSSSPSTRPAARRSACPARTLTRKRVESDSNIEIVLDWGSVGEPWHVEAPVLEHLIRSDIIPVIAPIGVGDHGETYNINADTVAGAVAGAVKAARLLLLTDVVGVLDQKKKLGHELSVAEAKSMISAGTISGGMIPKVETCMEAVSAGVEASVIIDGRVPHAILLELFADHGVGTLIRRRKHGR